jgi:hypothetical protein
LRILTVKKKHGFKKKMGVNKNISIFMLFDCVRVNTGLVFIESVIVGEKRGGRYM